jgi:hypothetical protein
MISRQVIARIEVQFWSSVIWLISESRLVQRCLRGLYQLKTTHARSYLVAALVWSGAGLLIGVILGLFGK